MLLLICALLPLLAGGALALIKDPRARRTGVLLSGGLTAGLMVYTAFGGPREGLILGWTDVLSLSLSLDRAGRVLWCLLAAVWLPSALFALEAMRGDAREKLFFVRYTLAFCPLILAGCAGNLLTLLLAYLLLTVLIILLAGHTRDQDGFRAGWRCARCLIPGALLALIGMIGLAAGGLGAFAGGGNAAAGPAPVVFCLLCFLGFGALTGLLPLTGWMADATLAPAPVSALLHALAGGVGVFSVMRLLYFAMPQGTLAGWPQGAMLALCVATAVYGEIRMLRTADVEMRLAWSTVSNLAFALLGLCLMSAQGLAAGLAHGAFHALAKIPLFFCTGIILMRTGHITVREMFGLGKMLPWTFGAFTLAGMSLMGMPPLPGFVSKYALITAAFTQGGLWQMVGALMMALSTVFTAIDIFTVVFPAFCLPASLREGEVLRDCGIGARIALLALCLLLLAASAAAGPIMGELTALGGGIGL